jgi:hypothetical protein
MVCVPCIVTHFRSVNDPSLIDSEVIVEASIICGDAGE